MVNNIGVSAGLFRQEDILHALQLLMYLTKYPHDLVIASTLLDLLALVMPIIVTFATHCLKHTFLF